MERESHEVSPVFRIDVTNWGNGRKPIRCWPADAAPLLNRFQKFRLSFCMVLPLR